MRMVVFILHYTAEHPGDKVVLGPPPRPRPPLPDRDLIPPPIRTVRQTPRRVTQTTGRLRNTTRCGRTARMGMVMPAAELAWRDLATLAERDRKLEAARVRG